MPPRKPRINLSAGPYGEIFFLDDAQKAAIESAYGHQLSNEVWEEIIDETADFVRSRPSLEGAAPLKEVLEALDQLVIKARSLRQLMHPTAIDWGDLSVPGIWSNIEFSRWSNRNLPRTSDLFELVFILIEPLIALGDFANRHRTDKEVLEQLGGPDEDTYWIKWVLCLSEITNKYGLPSAARQDSDTSEVQSEFVRFVSAIQNYLPAQCQKSTHSDTALAKMILRARVWYRSAREKAVKKGAEKANRLIEELRNREQTKLDELAERIKWRKRDFLFAFRKSHDPHLRSKKQKNRPRRSGTLYRIK